jgi:hypothetical protein
MDDSLNSLITTLVAKRFKPDVIKHLLTTTINRDGRNLTFAQAYTDIISDSNWVLVSNDNIKNNKRKQTLATLVADFVKTNESSYDDDYVKTNLIKIKNLVDKLANTSQAQPSIIDSGIRGNNKNDNKDLKIQFAEQMLKNRFGKQSETNQLARIQFEQDVDKIKSSEPFKYTINDWINIVSNQLDDENSKIQTPDDRLSNSIEFWKNVLSQLTGAASPAANNAADKPNIDQLPVVPSAKSDCEAEKKMSDELRNQIMRLQQLLAEKQNEFETIKVQLNAANNAIAERDNKIKALTDNVARLKPFEDIRPENQGLTDTTKIEGLLAQIETKQNRIIELEAELSKLKNKLATSVVSPVPDPIIATLQDKLAELQAKLEQALSECPKPTETTEIKSPSGDNVALSEGMVYIYQETRALKTGGHSKRLVKLEGDKLSIQNEDKTWSDFNQKLYDDMYTGGEEKLDNAPVKVNPDKIIETLQRIAPKPEKPP